MLISVRQAKGFKDRHTILSPQALELLRAYWKKYRPAVWLFETRRGKQISERAVGIALKKAMQKAGVSKQTGVHGLAPQLRHPPARTGRVAAAHTKAPSPSLATGE